MRLILLFFATIISTTAQARPLPTIETKILRDQMLSQPRVASGYDFEGIVSLSNCSGSLVRFSHSLPSDKALILTNGHCVGQFPAPGEVYVGVASQRTFDLLNPAGTRGIGTVRADLLVYATMTKTDMAIYRLTSTYAQIEQNFRTRALTLVEESPKVGLSIQVISGYWQRGYACQVQKIVHQLKEGRWTNEQSIRYSQPGCEVIGGTSGSPIVDPLLRTVVGVNNTGNESGGRCTDNNPCEIDENGKVEFEEGRSYGQQIWWIYTCLNDQRELDLNRQGCLLPN